MKLIFRHLSKEIYQTLVVMVLVLLFILISNQFVKYLAEVSSGVLTLHALLQLMVLQAPLLVGYMLPLGLYLSLLLVLGRFYADREMVVLSSCGMSQGQLLSMVAKACSVVILLDVLLMLWVFPAMSDYRERIIAQALSASPIEKMYPAKFSHFRGLPWTFYTQTLSSDHEKMQGVFIAKQKGYEHGLPHWEVMIAKEGSQKIDQESEAKYLVFDQGAHIAGVVGEQAFDKAQFAEYGIRFGQKPLQLRDNLDRMPTLALWEQSKHDPVAAARLQWRIGLPISAVLLMFLAVPLSTIKPRQGRFARIVPGMLIYIVYADMLFVSNTWIREGALPPGLGMWLVHGTFFVLVLLLYAVKHRRLPFNKGPKEK